MSANLVRKSYSHSSRKTKSKLYFTIRNSDPIEDLDALLHYELMETKSVKEVTRFASDIEYVVFDKHPEVLELALDIIASNGFEGVNARYFHKEVINPNNNLLLLFTNVDGIMQIECIVTYYTVEVKVNQKIKPAIHIPIIAVNKVVERPLSLSGADIMHWFYNKMKLAGGYSIEINAVNTAIKSTRKTRYYHTKNKRERV